MHYLKTILASLTIVVLQACSSSGDDLLNDNSLDDMGPDLLTLMANSVGIIELDSSEISASKFVFAQFLPLDGSVDSAADLNTIADFTLPAAGTCSIASEDPVRTLDTSALDVGESIILSSEAGTYATIEREDEEEGITYEAPLSIEGAFPASLALEVTDGDFQTTNGVPLPLALGVPSLIEPTLRSRVFADTVYQLDASSSSNGQSFIMLEINFTDVITNSVLCILPASGRFSLPEETLAILSARSEIAFDNSIGSLLAVGTAVTEVVQDNDSVFFVRHLHLTEGIRR